MKLLKCTPQWMISLTDETPLKTELEISSEKDKLRYADDTTLMAKWRGTKKSLDESEEESEMVGLKHNFHKTKMATGPMTPWQIDGETMETVTDFIFLGLQNHYRWWLQPWN